MKFGAFFMAHGCAKCTKFHQDCTATCHFSGLLVHPPTITAQFITIITTERLAYIPVLVCSDHCQPGVFRKPENEQQGNCGTTAKKKCSEVCFFTGIYDMIGYPKLNNLRNHKQQPKTATTTQILQLPMV